MSRFTHLSKPDVENGHCSFKDLVRIPALPLASYATLGESLNISESWREVGILIYKARVIMTPAGGRKVR